MLKGAMEIQSQQTKLNLQANAGAARWAVGLQVIESVIQCHIKHQDGINREDPPGRLAYRHTENSLVTKEGPERWRERENKIPLQTL